MNSTMESLRVWSPWFLNHWLWPMLWQSSLLVGALLVIDFALRRKLRPAVRYALWLVLLVKLVLPPSLALPTGFAWWVRPSSAPQPKAHTTTFTSVHYGPAVLPEPKTEPPATAPPPPPPLPLSAWALLGSGLVSFSLLAWMLLRWAQVAQTARDVTEAPAWLNHLLSQTKEAAGVRRFVRLRLVAAPLSPAVCGFFKPVILLPQALANLPAARLRTVLFHELHLRRGDVWVNCVQALLQVAYWWHPLLWLANARIRRLREEAVDDAVMLALREEACDYAPTLLEVARLALQRPLASLGLVGILESKTALRRRTERLVEFHAPRKAGLTFASVVGLGLFTAMAVPMGEAPLAPQRPSDTPNQQNSPWPDARFDGYSEVRLEPQFYIADGANLRAVLPALLETEGPTVLSSNDVINLATTLRQANAQAASANESFAKFSGGMFTWKVGGTTNTMVNYHTREVGGRTIVVGADVGLAATAPGWVPLEFSVVPWSDGNQLRCGLELGLSGNTKALQRATIMLPEHGAVLWAQPLGGFSGRYELVVLRRETSSAESEQTVRATAPSASPSQLAPANSTNTQTSATAPLDNFLKAQSKVQDGKLLFEMGKLDEAEASLSQALILNPQSQAAQYYLNLVREAHKVPVLGDLPIVGRMFQTSSSNLVSGTNPALYTRVFKVDPLAFEDSVNALPPLDPASLPWLSEPTVGNPSPGKAYLARIPQFFLNIGVDLNPPKSVFYKDLDGRLIVRATLQELDTIEAALKELGPSARTNQTLYVRIIKVDPTSFFEGLWSATGNQPTMNDPATLQKMLAAFFTSRGAEIKPPKSIFFNDREGSLVVRASLQDLDTIEQAVQILNITPPQIHIKAKFIAVPVEQLAELELEVGVNPANTRKQGEMILSAPLTQAFLKVLESNSDVDLVNEASVTTLSGRQTEIQVMPDVSDLAQTNKQSFLGIGKIANSGSLPTNPPPFGLTLDIYPSAHAADPTIQISGKAVATEFLGYDSPGALMIPTNWDTRLLKGDAVVIGQSALPIPHFRVREHSFDCTVYDGQTLLLGSTPSNAQKKDAAAGRSEKSLLVLITTTLIDPAGNRIHREDKPPK
jgi:beta-lactamase regulating signal transducer with metallopeptidase domain